MKPAAPLMDRMVEKIDVLAPDGCWTWTSTLTPDGYGKIRVQGRYLRAHRVIYEELVGPIPDGLQLDHLCRNRACCNPDHLEAVTHYENWRRGDHIGAVIRRTETDAVTQNDVAMCVANRLRGGRGFTDVSAARRLEYTDRGTPPTIVLADLFGTRLSVTVEILAQP